MSLVAEVLFSCMATLSIILRSFFLWDFLQRSGLTPHYFYCLNNPLRHLTLSKAFVTKSFVRKNGNMKNHLRWTVKILNTVKTFKDKVFEFCRQNAPVIGPVPNFQVLCDVTLHHSAPQNVQLCW